ncbi:MAG: hypothetical protein M5R36_01875 [Deltaproteobacteria bacterium]|nr:hypothetical protein [Deltaproteobacteria bacterium]
MLSLLNERFGTTEEDFVSAELELTPAGPARYVGLDRGFVGGYGHDDRVCSFTAVRALIDADDAENTRIAICFDKEEVGSFGNTGAQGRFLHRVIEESIRAAGAEVRGIDVSTALERSKVLSADVAAAIDPEWPDVHDRRNAARAGHGVVLKKFTGVRGKSGASDASAEYVGEIRRLFNAAGVPWQSAEMGKVDEGGGGTVAKFIANLGAEVLDVGPPVLSMHSPFELIHRGDVYAAYRAYRAFSKKA